jgi:predicted nucleic acid-binding protein
LLDVLMRQKFAFRLRQAQLTAPDIVDDVRRIALVVSPPNVRRVVTADPDDDHVLACAPAANAEILVSGDKHLLQLGSFEGIAIVKAARAVKVVGA